MEKTEKIRNQLTWKIVFGGMLALGLPAVFFYLLEFYTHNPFVEVRPWAQFFNVALFWLIGGILFCIFGSIRLAYSIFAAAVMLFGLANAYVVRFRTNPIVPWDIFSWKTAASVAGNYDYTPDGRMVIVTVLFLGIIAALVPVKLKWGRVICPKRYLAGGVLFVFLAAFLSLLQQEDFQNRYSLYNKLFTPVFMTEVDGIPVTFVMNLAYMTIDKPKGYKKQEADQLLAEYKTEDKEAAGEAGGEGKLPNVIVVMDEAFSDLSVLGEFAVNQDYLPYFHILQQGCENTVTGMLQVSVCGGNTANTEYEFLTGNTMAFLPQGSVPYQQYMTGACETLASHLRGLGYETIATHPYGAEGWERNVVYPWMGFSSSLFLEDYAGAEYVRNYVSDAACVEKIISLYEQKKTDAPLFLFAVTMQNHSGYEDAYANFAPDVHAEELDNFSVDQYLSLLKLSDAALAQLITYFSQASEDTVLVFFGDHQPSDTVAAPILAQNGMAWNALSQEELKLRYQVPYVIWANYDIDEAQNADTSANFLGAELLLRAGIPTTPYQNFLLRLKEEYPFISAVRTVRADGTETSASEEEGWMDTYRILQYYRMFDQGEELGNE